MWDKVIALFVTFTLGSFVSATAQAGSIAEAVQTEIKLAIQAALDDEPYRFPSQPEIQQLLASPRSLTQNEIEQMAQGLLTAYPDFDNRPAGESESEVVPIEGAIARREFANFLTSIAKDHPAAQTVVSPVLVRLLSLEKDAAVRTGVLELLGNGTGSSELAERVAMELSKIARASVDNPRVAQFERARAEESLNQLINLAKKQRGCKWALSQVSFQ